MKELREGSSVRLSDGRTGTIDERIPPSMGRPEKYWVRLDGDETDNLDLFDASELEAQDA